MAAPVFHVVENNPYAPQPFVLTEVAICLRDAIRGAGYACEHVVGRIDPDVFSIVLGGNATLERQWPHMDRARCAIFNFEQLGSTSNLAGPQYRQWLRDWLVLDYHSSNVEVLRRENGPMQEALELPIVPSMGLATGTPGEKTVDVLFYGTSSARRQAVLDEIRALGLTVEVVAGAYGSELAPALHRARLVLHIHYYSNGLFPVARVLQPVVQGVPVVCEASVFSAMNDWSTSGICFAPYEQLARRCAELLRSPQEMARSAEMATAFASRIDFATPFAEVARSMQRRALPELAAPPDSHPKPHPPSSPVELSDEEIEAILASEAAQPPEAGHAPAEIQIVRREPGQGRIGRWVAWLLLAFVVLGAINAYR